MAILDITWLDRHRHKQNRQTDTNRIDKDTKQNRQRHKQNRQTDTNRIDKDTNRIDK